MAKRLGSETDFYHVVTVGVGHQAIFEDDDDRRNFYKLIDRIGDEESIEFYAWCFMDNHVHLVVRCLLDALAKFMLRVERIYTEGFNNKHCRNGSLFQRPYWSEPILTDERMMAAVRYVHRNPLKAKMARTCSEYRWSSYCEYTQTSQSRLVRTDFMLAMLGGCKAFEAFHKKEDARGKFLDTDTVRLRRSNDEVIAFAHEIIGLDSLSKIGSLPKAERDARLHLLKENGLTINQIARITGLGKGIIARA